MSGSNHCFLTWIQVSRETGKVVCLVFPSLKNFPQFVVIHTTKGFNIVNEAEVDVFLEFPFFYNPMNIGNLISGSSASLKPSLYIWKILVHLLLKPRLKDFKHNLASLWNECNCMVVWTFYVTVLLWDWNENWPFPVNGHCWVFQICWHTEWITLAAASFSILNSWAVSYFYYFSTQEKPANTRFSSGHTQFFSSSSLLSQETSGIGSFNPWSISLLPLLFIRSKEKL